MESVVIWMILKRSGSRDLELKRTNGCGGSAETALVASALTLLIFHMTKLPLSRAATAREMLVATRCFVPCVAGPVLLWIPGHSSLVTASEAIDPVFVVSSALLGSATLIPAYCKKHRRCSCLVLFIRAFSAWRSCAISTG